MTWTRIGDNWNTRADMLEVPRSARLLHIEALVYCNQEMLNGRLPRGALRRITDAEDPELDAKHLIDAGVWAETDTGWLVDWSDQEDSEVIRRRKADRAETQKRYRERTERHKRDDHSMCDPRFCKKASVTGNATDNSTGHETPSLPVPSRPEGRGQGQGAAARPAGAGEPVAAADDPHWVTHWVQTPDAHPFIEGGGNNCEFEDGKELCLQPERNWRHGHHWQATSVTDRACVTCDQPRWHGIHFDRRFSDPGAVE